MNDDDDVGQRVFELAAMLRERHGNPTDRVTFTHIPCTVSAAEALEALRSSALADLVPADGEVINHPEQPWYGPIAVVRANPTDLHGVTVTASTWDGHQSYAGRAAALEIRLVFGEPPAQVHEGYSLWASNRSPATLSRSLYDHQRAETGYEGDDWVTRSPSIDVVNDFLSIVRKITGVGLDR